MKVNTKIRRCNNITSLFNWLIPIFGIRIEKHEYRFLISKNIYHLRHPLHDYPYNISIHYTNWGEGMNVKTYNWDFADYRKFKRALKFKFRWMFLFF
jgi:hypothetical protein